MLILASQSPRRQELMRLITDDFTVVLSQTDEALPDHISPEEAVRTLAERKCAEVFREHPLDTVIGADTLVAIGTEILGKPRDEADAKRMLRMLSGAPHSVFTGVCVMSPGWKSVFAQESRVFFYELEESEIDRYVATGEPADKAGAYGIQEKGGLFVHRIEGDYFNIMGLPVAALYRVLQERPWGAAPNPA